MSFNESEFRQLAAETKQKAIMLGTTCPVSLQRHNKYTERLVEFLRLKDLQFNRESCLQWVDSFEHDSCFARSASYYEWIRMRRFVNLLAEQEAGTLSHWKQYLNRRPDMPENKTALELLEKYGQHLRVSSFSDGTIKKYTAYARRLLIHWESQGAANIVDMQNKDLAAYFTTERFKGRKPQGIADEVTALRNFIVFLEDNDHIECKTLLYAIPRYRFSAGRIITTITPEMEAAILRDLPESKNSPINLRDKAVCLLALHAGLRGCDIRNLKFADIDWENSVISIMQSKTGVSLKIWLDNETHNAIVDYILNERRDCQSRYIFITTKGMARKIVRVSYRVKYRAKGSASYDSIPHDGLHILRRTFSSRLLQSGTPLSMISEMLGHIDKSAVQHYLTTEEEKMKRCSLSMSKIPYKGGIF